MIDPGSIDPAATYVLSGAAIIELLQDREGRGGRAPVITGVQGQIAVQEMADGSFSVGFASELPLYLNINGEIVRFLVPMRLG